MEDNIIEEKFVSNGLKPVNIETTEEIVHQMKKCVCKIYSKGKKGTGFFTKIPYKDSYKKVLITNNHILGENEIKDNNIISFVLNNNEQDKKTIKIKKDKKRYTNEILDITIIELEENKDDIYDYIEIDGGIKEDMNLKKEDIINSYRYFYNNESIYILNYLNGDKIVVSYGLLTNINEDNGIDHKCNTEKGSSGSPILSLQNNKLIGVHRGGYQISDLNNGTLIIYPIIEFNKMNNNLCIVKKNKENKENKKKENKFNNIIYYNENTNNQEKDISIFKEKTNGAFIFCDNLESLKLIGEEILYETQKDSKIIFNMIVRGYFFEKIMGFLREQVNFGNCLRNICIYCVNQNEYMPLKDKYKIIHNDIYDIPNEVIKFINNTSSDNIKLFPLRKIITYSDYLNKYKYEHSLISRFYGDLTPESFEKYFEKIKLLIKKEFKNMGRIDEIINSFLVFKINNNIEKQDELIIREYCRGTFSRVLKNGLMNSELDEAIAYFSSRLMYSLNSYGLKNNRYFQDLEEIVYLIQIYYNLNNL